MKTLGALLFVSFLAAASAVASDSASIDSELLEIDGSGVHGHVMLVDLPAGGTLAVVNVAGLAPDADYVLVRATGDSCDIESYDESEIIATVTANPSGRATATQELEGEIDGIGTVSVWTVEDALVACSMTPSGEDQ